ncbi:2141_t:CDS:2, partial [Gigaspora rosea]
EPSKDKGATNQTSDYYQKAADMEYMGSTNKPPQKLLKNRPTEAVEEAKVFRVIAQEYFTKDADKEIEKESEEEMSDNEYYKESKELTHIQIEQEKLQKVVIQVAWELWQEVTWSRQIDYNLGPLCGNEPQLMDIDEVYLIDIPQWGDPVIGLEFEEEIGQETSTWKNSSFTWNQASTSKNLFPDMEIDPD